MSQTSDSTYIIEWLNNCDDSGTLADAHEPHVTRKRRLSFMDEITPTQKRHKPAINLHDGPILLTNIARDCANDTRLSDSPTKSSASSLTQSSKASNTSRSKRKRPREVRYSNILSTFPSRDEATTWESSHIADVPGLQELLECIQDGEERIHPDAEDIVREVARCKTRKANEETWSDDVVRPVLNAARKSSVNRQAIDIINMKTIDIAPPELLPKSPDIDKTWKRRIDYSIGLEVAKTAEMTKILATAEDHTLTQCAHDLVVDRALCSYLEIKASSDTETAEAQLITMCSAAFQKQKRNRAVSQDLEAMSQPIKLAPQVAWLWQPTHVQLWVAVIDLEENMIFFLDKGSFPIDAYDSKPLSRVIQVMSRVMDWGFTSYLPWFRKHIGREDLNIDVTPQANDPG